MSVSSFCFNRHLLIQKKDCIREISMPQLFSHIFVKKIKKIDCIREIIMSQLFSNVLQNFIKKLVA